MSMNKHITQKIYEQVATENNVTVKTVIEIIAHCNSELKKHVGNVLKGFYITKILLYPFLTIKLNQ